MLRRRLLPVLIATACLGLAGFGPGTKAGGGGQPTVSLSLPVSNISFGPYAVFSSGDMPVVSINNCRITRKRNWGVTLSIMAGDTHLRSGTETIPLGQLQVWRDIAPSAWLSLTTTEQDIINIAPNAGSHVDFDIRFLMTLTGTEAATDGYPPYTADIIVTAIIAN